MFLKISNSMLAKMWDTFHRTSRKDLLLGSHPQITVLDRKKE